MANNITRPLRQSPDTDFQSINGTSTSSPKARAKLPKLELPTFAGDPIKWQAFWDSFECKVHTDSSISEVDKLHYLLKLLEGEAADAVIGYRPTADNYPVVLSVLQERFGNKETAKFKHFEALFALPSSDSDQSKLKEIYNECEKHIRCLVALGLPEDTFGQVFVPLILSKLPHNTWLQLHRSQGSNHWDLHSLRELMKQEILARDLTDRFSKGFGSSGSGLTKDNSHSSRPATFSASKFKPAKKWVTQGALVSHTDTQAVECSFCRGSHFSDACNKFTTVDSRKSVLSNQCFKCLKTGHRVADCKRKKPCYYCKGKDHHSSLCLKQFSSGKTETKSASSSYSSGANRSKGQAQTTISLGTCTTQTTQTVLKMATVWYPAIRRSVRIYFDDGSSTSYITSQLATELDLKLSEDQFVSVGRFGSKKREAHKFQMAELPIPLRDSSVFTVAVHVIPNITSSVYRVPLDLNQYPALKALPLADSICQQSEMVPIDVLIGGDCLHHLFTGERIDFGNGLFLYGSKLGYVAAGSVQSTEIPSLEQTAVVLFTQSNRIHPDQNHVEKFWALEHVGIKDNPYVTDDDIALSKFNNTITNTDNRYQVGLPWRNDALDLPDNFGLAMGRLTSLMKRLKDKPDTLHEYNTILKRQITAGIIEPVADSVVKQQVHYIPHHCVSKPDSSTTKLRIVYDASAKASKHSNSLNDSLLRGPVIVQDLCGFLMRFRTFRVATIADIEKAFHQISISPSERDMLRFLWLKDPSKPVSKTNLEIFRFARIPFGMVCSPFLLDRTIRHHLSSKDEDVAKDVLRNIYVDNIQAGSSSVEDAIQVYHKIKGYFAEISMNVREWFSNSTEFIKSISSCDVGQSTCAKVMGFPWNTQMDSLSFPKNTQFHELCTTKRQFLSILSTTFDPCGWISPILTQAKSLVQTMWKSKLGWDEPVPSDLLSQFSDVVCELKGVADASLPRQVNQYISQPEAHHELHCFVDASIKAYAAVVYIRSSLPNGKVSVGLIMSKCRLAPIKPMTMPRLELMGTTIGVRLLNFVHDQVAPKIQVQARYVWTDSKCVLFWLQSSRRLKVFVFNRISEIKCSPTIQFRYVPTACNPADIPSRGTDASTLLKNDLWWNGPSFLLLKNHFWPENISPDTEPKEALLEITKVATTNVANEEIQKIGIAHLMDVEKFSKWHKLIRVTGFVLLAVDKFSKEKRSQASETSTLSIENYTRAKLLWIMEAQLSLDSPQRVKPTTGFSQVTDSNGVVHAHGRLANADLQPSAKEPILLPRNNHITSLIIRSYHEMLTHAGIRQTLASLRSHYWVSQGRRQVEKVINSCRVCRKAQGGPFPVPEFPPLPAARVTQACPFERTGIDYFGPLLVKCDQSPDGYMKIWVALFACCATRAVHLDIVSELSTEQFLLCFRRFTAIYGVPRLIITDNAKHFKSADHIFRQAAKEWTAAIPISWKFITELSPWMGGFYERLVGTVKTALRKSLGQKRLQRDQLQTIIFEIAAIVNTRPLVATNTEFQPGETALTPAHFLAKRGRTDLPVFDVEANYLPGGHTHTSQQLLESWKTGQKILDEYWRCWKNEYLLSLQEHAPLGFKQRNQSAIQPAIGVVVQIQDNTPRCKWRLGVIKELPKSADGLCRSAKLRLSGGKILRRPLKLLYPLEEHVMDTHTHTHTEGTDTQQTIPSLQPPVPTSSTRKSIRKAAERARDRTVAGYLELSSDEN